MRCNFKIRCFIAVELDGREFDLHNNFSFVAYSLDQEADELKVYFERSTGDWVPRDEYDKLNFTFSKIHYFKTIDPDPEFITEDGCLSGITFFYPDERDEHLGLLDRPEPEDGDDVIFTFQSDRVIRVNCDVATLSVERIR